MNKTLFFRVQVVLAVVLGLGTQTLNATHTPVHVARYILYLLTLEAITPVCQHLHSYLTVGNINIKKLAAGSKSYALAFAAWLAILVYKEESLFREDFVHVAFAFLFVKSLENMAEGPTTSISYGVGMACSFFEGYLVHVLPSDGAKFVGFEENIRALEDKHGVLFPVKKLFIIITKNMYCPPDLKDFNKRERMDLPYLESFDKLEDVKKSVAGVKDRVYRNTAYKAVRPAGASPVCLAAECATPLHTLHRVLGNTALYRELAGIDVATVVDDFCKTLKSIIDKSHECRGKCELIYYDNEDPTQNLADIILNRIRELVPDFEERIIARKQDNVIENHK